MSSIDSYPRSDHVDGARPLCPTCHVAMWLVEIEHMPGAEITDRLRFECKVCEAKAIVPPLD